MVVLLFRVFGLLVGVEVFFGVIIFRFELVLLLGEVRRGFLVLGFFVSVISIGLVLGFLVVVGGVLMVVFVFFFCKVTTRV